MNINKRLLVKLTVALVLVGGGVTTWAVTEHEEGSHHFHAVDRGVLYRGRQPHEADLREGVLRRQITQVINLRPRAEDPEEFDREQNTCRQLGVQMANVPMGRVDMPPDEQIEEFLRLVRSSKTSLVHCELGKSRTGIAVAAYRVLLENWDVQRATREMGRFDGYVTPARTQFLERLTRDREQWLTRTTPLSPERHS